MKKFICLYIVFFLFGLTISGYAQTGIIYIKSNPTGAKVFINGEATQKITPFQQVLPTGKYTFRISLDLYHDYEGQFTINQNSIEKSDIQLKPNYGSISINSNPSEAEIFLDGKSVGKTPLVYDHIVSGKHTIELHKTRYTTQKEELEVQEERTTEKIYTMAPGFGTIGIRANPDADIYINGQKVGPRIYSGQIDAGTYSIEFRQEKYFTQTKKISIENGQEYILNVDLKPLIGSLSILTTPPEAQVYLDGQLVGPSPQIIKDLKVGEYQVKVVMSGYDNYEKTINVSLDKSTLIDVQLQSGQLISIESDPAGASIVVDNESKGVTPIDINLRKGVHLIKLSKLGFFDKDTTLIVNSDEKLQLTLEWPKKIWSVETKRSQPAKNILLKRNGTRLEIYYDLAGDIGNIYTVNVFYSADKGKSWGTPVKKISGDVGNQVTAGKSKLIKWDIFGEGIDPAEENMLKIEAVINWEQKNDTSENRDLDSSKVGQGSNSIQGSLEGTPILYRSGLKKFYQKEFEAAVTDFSKVLDSNPKYVNALYYKGLCEIQLGKKDAGCLDLKEAAKLGSREAVHLMIIVCKE